MGVKQHPLLQFFRLLLQRDKDDLSTAASKLRDMGFGSSGITSSLPSQGDLMIVHSVIMNLVTDDDESYMCPGVKPGGASSARNMMPNELLARLYLKIHTMLG
jgi:hypothetical protein